MNAWTHVHATRTTNVFMYKTNGFIFRTDLIPQLLKGVWRIYQTKFIANMIIKHWNFLSRNSTTHHQNPRLYRRPGIFASNSAAVSAVGPAAVTMARPTRRRRPVPDAGGTAARTGWSEKAAHCPWRPPFSWTTSCLTAWAVRSREQRDKAESWHNDRLWHTYHCIKVLVVSKRSITQRLHHKT